MTRSSSGARRFDAIIVGSGIGGLAAALTLTRKGHSVLVLEAGKQFGGYCNPFQRRHYGFDPGLHYIGECGPGQAFSRMIEDLGLASDLHFRELSPDGFDRLRFPGYEVSTPVGADRYRDRLAKDFPQERRGLDKFFAILREFGDAVRSFDRVRGVGSALAFAPHAPSLLRWVTATFADVLDATVKDPLLRAVLAAQGGDYGLPPSKASALIGLGVLDHYLRGAYFPIGGSRKLRDAFVHAIERTGGELKRNHAVDKIVITNGHVSGVRCKNGEEFTARTIVSNVDATTTYRDLVGEPNIGRLLRRKVERSTHSFGSVCLFIGTDIDVAAAGMTDANVWSYPSIDIEGCYAPMFAGRLPPDDFFFLSSPTLKDAGSERKAPPGHHTLELVTLVPYEPFARWTGTKSMKRGAEYERFKAELGDRYLGCVEQLVPGIRDHIKVMEVATPVTNISYALSPRGAIYGPEHTPGQMVPFRFAPKAPVEGLYLCGSSVLGAGVVPCGISGFKAGRMAAKALGEGRGKQGIVERIRVRVERGAARAEQG